eukprot:scaffold102850_cov63-Phaeocystis_antarctica.AAC.2
MEPWLGFGFGFGLELGSGLGPGAVARVRGSGSGSGSGLGSVARVRVRVRSSPPPSSARSGRCPPPRAAAAPEGEGTGQSALGVLHLRGQTQRNGRLWRRLARAPEALLGGQWPGLLPWASRAAWRRLANPEEAHQLSSVAAKAALCACCRVTVHQARLQPYASQAATVCAQTATGGIQAATVCILTVLLDLPCDSGG